MFSNSKNNKTEFTNNKSSLKELLKLFFRKKENDP